MKDINININNNNNKNSSIVDENDSRENLKFPHNTIDILNDEKQQKISINKNSYINNNIIRNSSVNNKDTINYDRNPMDSVINVKDSNIRNTIESDFSDIK